MVLERPLDEASHLVTVALANTDGIVEVTRDGDVVVGRTRGGLASSGETINVHLVDEGPETAVAVWVDGGSGFGMSDPWKYKNAFMEELASRRDLKPGDFPPAPTTADLDDRTDATDLDIENQNALVWIAAGKFLLYLLAFLLLVVGVVVAVSLL